MCKKIVKVGQHKPLHKELKVSLDIRFLKRTLQSLPTLSLLLFGHHAIAQDALLIKPTTQELNEATVQTNPDSTILRLEDTIRGNKEQPQVLTIVPWQLPVHQRINENTQWQLQVTELASIERNTFLRNLAIVKEIKALDATTSVYKKSTNDTN